MTTPVDIIDNTDADKISELHLVFQPRVIAKEGPSMRVVLLHIEKDTAETLAFDTTPGESFNEQWAQAVNTMSAAFLDENSPIRKAAEKNYDSQFGTLVQI